MPFVDLSKVRISCEVTGCKLPGRLDRHHTGCQKMFVRHFERSRRNTKRYLSFVERYWEFHPDDCVTLCAYHHEEIHRLYGPLLQYHILRIRQPVCRWSWKQVEIFITDLHNFCMMWLADPTLTASIYMVQIGHDPYLTKRAIRAAAQYRAGGWRPRD